MAGGFLNFFFLILVLKVLQKNVWVDSFYTYFWEFYFF